MTATLDFELALAARRLAEHQTLARRFHPRHRAEFDARTITRVWRIRAIVAALRGVA